MNRCTSTDFLPLWRRALLRLALAAPLLGMTAWATAQVNARPFPPQAERGVMQVIAPPVIQMSGKPDRLSPGSRIRGMNNMLLMSGSVIGQNLVVNFVRNTTGEVHDVWVLTDAEAALKLPTKQ